MNEISNFDFILPTKIRFGCGIVKEVGMEAKKLNATRALIVTDKGIIKAGLIERILESLANADIETTVFSEVEPNPRDTTVQKGAELAKTKEVDVIVAIGGGSSMDVAKSIGVVLTHGGQINDYEGLDTIEKSVTPLIAIPTTVGTGSEVTFWAVITDTKRHFKMSVGSPLIAPKIALVDPEMVETLPPHIIASTGIDALTHAIEGYTCLLSEPITDAAGIYAIEMIASNIKKAVYTDDKNAKGKMLLGSLIAGIAFGNSDIAGVHSMAEAIGGLYDTPHGVANAIILPYVMEYNFVADTKKFARIAEAMGEDIRGLSERDAAYSAVEAVRKLNKDLKMPNLKEVGVLEKDLDELAKRSAENVSAGSNTRKATASDFLDIFKTAFNN